MDHDVVAKSADRLMAGRFTLDDFLAQLQQVRKMGSLGGIMQLMPGMSKEMRQAADQIDDGQVSRVEAIVRSMTPAERAEPDHHRRLAPGPHRPGQRRPPTQEVNQLLKQFKEMRRMMRGANPAAVAAMGGMGGGKLSRLAAARELAKSGGADQSLSDLLGGRTGSGQPPAATASAGCQGAVQEQEEGWPGHSAEGSLASTVGPRGDRGVAVWSASARMCD